MATDPATRLLDELVASNPNGFRLDRLPPSLQTMTIDDVDAAVSSLEQRHLISVQNHTNRLVPGRTYKTVGLVNVNSYPIHETIRVGDLELPRMIAGDTVGGSDLNTTIETIAKIDEYSRRRNEELLVRLTRRYWANTATVLGTFLAVFALILRSSEPLVVDDRGPRDLFLLKLAEVAPLAIVLALFVIATYVLLRKI